MPSPLDVMLSTMNRKWAEGDEDGAVQLAKAAAPYVHARAQARAATELSGMDDDELDAFDRDRTGDADGAGHAGGGPGEP